MHVFVIKNMVENGFLLMMVDIRADYDEGPKLNAPYVVPATITIGSKNHE